MSEHVLEQLAVSHRPLKRAQYEAFSFTLSPDGVLVRNGSYANPHEHEYQVTVEDGVPTACDCPADTTSETACKHRLAVAIRTPVLQAAQQSAEPVRADGGVTEELTTTDAGDDAQAWCSCGDLSGEFPCWECYRRGRKPLPDD